MLVSIDISKFVNRIVSPSGLRRFKDSLYFSTVKVRAVGTLTDDEEGLLVQELSKIKETIDAAARILKFFIMIVKIPFLLD
jgi:hypothetical protein